MALACALSTSEISASPESERLRAEAYALIKSQDHTAALDRLEQALIADPADGKVLFLRGVVFNRTNRPQAAATELEFSELLGVSGPDLDFEMGWALLGSERWREAAERFEAHEVARPGLGKASEFLGRAYLGMGDLERAEASLREAIRRDPALAETARYHLARTAVARNDYDGARDELAALLRDFPESDVARTLATRLAQITPKRDAAPRKPWRIVASVGGGYNDNVIALGDGVDLPSDISDESSAFGRFTGLGEYRWDISKTDQVTASYGFLINQYAKVPSADLVDQSVAIAYARRLDDDLAVSLRGSDAFALLDERVFSNRWQVQPSLAWRATDWATVQVLYGFTDARYYFPTNVVQDRDSRRQDLAATTFLRLPDTALTGRLGVFGALNNADGRDNDFYALGFTLGLGYALPWDVALDLSYARSFDRYDWRHSLSGIAGYEYRREDETDRVTVQVTRPIAGPLEAFARYDYTRDDSNIVFFDYEQQVATFGLTVRY